MPHSEPDRGPTETEIDPFAAPDPAQPRHSPTRSRRTEIEIDDARTVVVEVTPDRSSERRVDVILGAWRWEFDVASDVATLRGTFRDGRPADRDDLPAWMIGVLQRIGLRGVEA